VTVFPSLAIVSTYQLTWFHNPKDQNMNFLCNENLWSYIFYERLYERSSTSFTSVSSTFINTTVLIILAPIETLALILTFTITKYFHSQLVRVNFTNLDFITLRNYFSTGKRLNKI
jgi:hypothetical protein